jgi:tetratricopeptide (TPR) repeat protein
MSRLRAGTAFSGAASMLILTAPAPARAAPPPDDPLMLRHGADVDELRALELAKPEALSRLQQGEQAMAAGRLEDAVKLFRQGTELAPKSELIGRRLCQTLTELGRAGDAIMACSDAMVERRTPMTFRAMVAALMLDTPHADALAFALVYAEEAGRRMPDQPWGPAAECDIARRVGDRTMLDACLRKLDDIAPSHYETRRAHALDAGAGTPPPWVVPGWLLLALSFAGTLLHAVWRAGRRSLRGAAAVAIALATASVQEARAEGAGGNQPAVAGGFSKWPVSDVDPVNSLPTAEQRDRDPLHFGYHLMDLADRAEAAVKKSDFAKAAGYYAAMAKAVPDAAIGFRRACEYYEKAGDRDKALEYCREALGVEGVIADDHARFARLLLARSAPLSAQDREDVTAIVQHLRMQEQHALAAHVQCELAARLEDDKQLAECSTALGKLAPDDPKTITYQWLYAIHRRDFAEADRLVARAARTDMQSEGARRMAEVTRRERSPLRWFQLHLRWILAGAGALALLVALVLAVQLVRRRRAAPTAGLPAGGSA